MSELAIMDILYPLVIPTISVISASYYLSGAVANTQDPAEEHLAFNVENIKINIFQGQQSQTLEVQNTLTPTEIAEKVYVRKNLIGKQVVVACSGRRLNNDMSIGLQGVRNGDFFHIQLNDLQNNEKRKGSKKEVVKVAGGCLGACLLWVMYLDSPAECNFSFRAALIAITEMVGFMIYKMIKRYQGK